MTRLEAIVIEEVIKHQPGKHDQASHAGTIGANKLRSAITGKDVRLTMFPLSKKDVESLNTARTIMDRADAELKILSREKKWNLAGAAITHGLGMGALIAGLAFAPATFGLSAFAGITAFGANALISTPSLAFAHQAQKHIDEIETAKISMRDQKSLVAKSLQAGEKVTVNLKKDIDRAKTLIGKIILETSEEKTKDFAGTNEEKRTAENMRNILIRYYGIIKDI